MDKKVMFDVTMYSRGHAYCNRFMVDEKELQSLTLEAFMERYFTPAVASVTFRARESQ